MIVVGDRYGAAGCSSAAASLMEPTKDDARSESDGRLARRVAAGDDREAEAELLQRLERRARLFGMRHLRDEGEARELAQEVVLLVLRRLRTGEVRDPDRIGSFALGAARHLLREVRRDRPSSQPFEPAMQPTFDAPEPLDVERLAKCIEALGERERSVTTLTWYGQEGAHRIAEVLGTTPGNVRVLRHRALARLRACLEEEA